MTRQEVERFAPGTDARTRAEYRQTRYERSLAGIQPDLFGAEPIEHFHRNPSVPAPATPPEPAPATRPTQTAEERQATIAGAANWLRVGQRVRIVASAASLRSRTGIVWRLCGPVFADHAYVRLDLTGTQRAERIRMIELHYIEPIER